MPKRRDFRRRWAGESVSLLGRLTFGRLLAAAMAAGAMRVFFLVAYRAYLAAVVTPRTFENQQSGRIGEELQRNVDSPTGAAAGIPSASKPERGYSTGVQQCPQ